MELCNVVELTKFDQCKQFCAEAAAQSLEPDVCRALKIAGQEELFDALRAPVSVRFCGVCTLIASLGWAQQLRLPACEKNLLFIAMRHPVRVEHG